MNVKPNYNFPFPEKPWPEMTDGHHAQDLIVSGSNDWTVRCACGFWAGPFSTTTDAGMAWDDHLADS